MEKNYIERICQLCEKPFHTVRSDAKFCCTEHRMKVHRLTNTHIRFITLSKEELVQLCSILGNYMVILDFPISIIWKGQTFEKGAYLYITKSDFYNTFSFQDRCVELCTPPGYQGLRAFRIKYL